MIVDGYVERNGTEVGEQPEYSYVKRIIDCFEALGIKKAGSMHVECVFGSDGDADSGRQYEGGLRTRMMSIDESALTCMEGKSNKLAALKKKALEKLTPEEQRVLGLLK